MFLDLEWSSTSWQYDIKVLHIDGVFSWIMKRDEIELPIFESLFERQICRPLCLLIVLLRGTHFLVYFPLLLSLAGMFILLYTLKEAKKLKFHAFNLQNYT